MRARTVATVVLAASLLLSTTGCSFFAVNSTLKPYDASDGVGAIVGQVKVRNAILLSSDGQLASFVVNFINDGTSPVDMLVQYNETSSTGATRKVNTRIPLAAGEVRTYGSSDTPQFLFNGIDAKVGTLFPVFIQYGTGTGTQLLVPVLNGALKEYSTLLPTPLPTTTVPAGPPVGPTVIPIPTPSASATSK